MQTTRSADGTVLAYDRVGDGPALVVSVGALCDRHSFVPSDELTSRFTVYTYDRRGRGDSGDAESYAPQREVEDLAAVVAATGDTPFVFGHSSGAAIALRAAAAGVPMAGLVAYEAPFTNDDAPEATVADPAAHLRELDRAGRRDEALVFWMRDVVHAPAVVAEQLATAPWAVPLRALVPTLPYDIAVTDGGLPVAELGRIGVPVVVLGGRESPQWFQRSVAEQAAAIRDARLVMIDGEGHNAPVEVLAPILLTAFQPT